MGLRDDVEQLLTVIDDLLLLDVEKIERNYGPEETEQVLQVIDRLRRYVEYPPKEVTP